MCKLYQAVQPGQGQTGRRESNRCTSCRRPRYYRSRRFVSEERRRGLWEAAGSLRRILFGKVRKFGFRFCLEIGECLAAARGMSWCAPTTCRGSLDGSAQGTTAIGESTTVGALGRTKSTRTESYSLLEERCGALIKAVSIDRKS